jgi:hypothetical protein
MTQKDFEVDLQTIERYPTVNFFAVQTLSRLKFRPQELANQTVFYFLCGGPLTYSTQGCGKV